ncbi:MAG TPA: efflux transporter outer membrane subunit [Acetobacteraceae bacterium]|nr:efflux transporter outer membrane subunit [Acetobacteraceae bacterium]
MRHGLSTACLATALSGCAVGPDFHVPPAPHLRGYTETPLPASTIAVAAKGGGAQHFAVGRDVAGAWWELFRSPRLTGLVVTALARNPSLEASRQTLRQAQETALAAEGSFFPQVQAQGNRIRQQISPAESGLSSATAGFAAFPPFTVYTGQLNISYTFDVWGLTRRTVEADQAQAESQRFQLEGAANVLAANTANAAINAAALEAEIDAENKLIAAEQRLLATVRRQFAVGAATGTDVATQETQLANTQALVVPLQTQLVQTRDQLAAYLGRAPSEADIPPITLDELTLPGELPVSLSSQLVGQRPDIRAAQAQLHAATAQVGVAVANRLPQFTLSGFIGSAPSQFNELFTPGNGIWGITSQILGPVFEGGTLLHQQRAAVAAMKSSAANYQNVVILAFQNVADALTAVTQDARALQANQTAASAADRSLKLAQLQYGAGGVAYPVVLQAQTQYQTAVVNLIKAEAARYTDTVALFAALGGGWWNRAAIAPAPEPLLRSLLP